MLENMEVRSMISVAQIDAQWKNRPLCYLSDCLALVLSYEETDCQFV